MSTDENEDPMADDLCDKCMRSDLQISHTDKNGDTVCSECAEGDCEDGKGQAFKRVADRPGCKS